MQLGKQSRRKKDKIRVTQLGSIEKQSCILNKNKLQQLLSTRRGRSFGSINDYFQPTHAFLPSNLFATIQNHQNNKLSRFNKCMQNQTIRYYDPEIFSKLRHRQQQCIQNRQYVTPSGKGTVIFLKAKSITPGKSFLKTKSLTPAKRSYKVRKIATHGIGLRTCQDSPFRENQMKNIHSLELKDISLKNSRLKQNEPIQGWNSKRVCQDSEVYMF